MKQMVISRMLMGLAMVMAASTVLAAEGDVDYRKATMAAIGGHLRAAGTIVQGKVAHKADLKIHAAALRDLARSTEHIFDKSSATGDTKAKKEIWEKPAEFETVRKNFVTVAEAFATAAAGTDEAATRQAFAKVGEACRTCHSTYRSQ
jgi:cytochrome c556